MKVVVLFIFGFILCALAECNQENESNEQSWLRHLQKRGVFDCKARDQECTGIIKCCGTLQCYWPDGYSLLKKGHCVECIKKNQLCQRDNQCCSGLVCQKQRFGYTDGMCDVKRPRGGDCHENDQCLSGTCNVTAWQIASREEGKCA